MLATTFAGQAMASRVRVAVAPKRALVIQNAHKKGAGSTKNGRDSNPKMRGIKVYGGQPVKAGGIIVRQCGSTWNAGDNTLLGKDYTVFSTVEGVVIFDKKRVKPEIHVYPMDHPKSIAALSATHTKKPAEGVPSRAERRKATYTSRRGTGSLAVAQVAAPVIP
ncbi:50S ribosomal protein L27 [Tetrabaena socialis]|uniref:50S ribosomal protein L27 n=1 Tax=Tetrabaena socialis TaxID=47790 RepID=A0A2J8A0S2_9CHLO|nr:50S ribosomal protein L27 [Tetrabaena socialis]|eukprot:PNH06116.1 50S ribosomal protein L27 [Tetrabaena socialis]